MQFTIATVALAFTSVVVALPQASSANVCNTGSLQCCQSVQSATDSPAASLLGLLGVVLGSVDAQVGVTCSPISVIAVAGNSCSAQPACCTNNNFNGIVALGCTPVNLNL